MIPDHGGGGLACLELTDAREQDSQARLFYANRK
jgi:hypothetical protein